MTNLGCDRFEEVCALVAAGAATPDEKQAFQAHLAEGCPACSNAYRELLETNARLAEWLPPIQPPPGVRDRLLNAIAREGEVTPDILITRPSTSHRMAPRLPWPWAIGWAFAGVLGMILLWNTNMQRQETMRLETALQDLRLTVVEKEEALRFLEARQTQTVQLAGLSPSPSAFGRVFWNPQVNAGFLVVSGLPPLPEGKVYQLWAIRGTVPIDAGIFSPDPKGTATLKVKSLPDPDQTVQLFAITIEPAGGSLQPTGEMYLKGVAAPL